MKIIPFKGIFKHLYKLLRLLLSSPHDLSSPPLDQITTRTHQIYSDLVSTKNLNKTSQLKNLSA